MSSPPTPPHPLALSLVVLSLSLFFFSLPPSSCWLFSSFFLSHFFPRDKKTVNEGGTERIITVAKETFMRGNPFVKVYEWHILCLSTFVPVWMWFDIFNCYVWICNYMSTVSRDWCFNSMDIASNITDGNSRCGPYSHMPHTVYKKACTHGSMHTHSIYTHIFTCMDPFMFLHVLYMYWCLHMNYLYPLILLQSLSSPQLLFIKLQRYSYPDATTRGILFSNLKLITSWSLSISNLRGQ